MWILIRFQNSDPDPETQAIRIRTFYDNPCPFSTRMQYVKQTLFWWVLWHMWQVSASATGSNITGQVVNEDGVQFNNVYRLEAKDDFANVIRKDYYDISYFCHRGMEPSLPRFWSSITFYLHTDTADYSVSHDRALNT